MYNYNQHLHFIGIGGVGMAGIAEVLINLGYSISGSDAKSSQLTDHLTSLGATIAIGHNSTNIPQRTSVVVTSSAIQSDNCELIEARQRQIPVIPRAEMLAELMRMKYGIAIAGSHGKTTTTSMTAKLLTDAGLDPTVIIGGRLLSQPTGAQVGMGQYLVAEADESDGSFNLLRPAIATVTNIDAEHLSHYGSFGALEAAFERFMSSVPFYGVVVACFDDPVVARIAGSLKRRCVSYGLSATHDLSAANIVCQGNTSTYTLLINGKEEGEVTLPMPGIHMVKNSLAAIGVGLELGVYPEEAIESLRTFPGVGRRSEKVGEVGGILVLDDYGHHPTEIKATLKAIKQSWLTNNPSRQGGRLVVLFQPHRYSRTKELFSEFLTAFDLADVLYITDIYSAGEPAIEGINAEALVKAIHHPHHGYAQNTEGMVAEVVAKAQPGDVIVTLGAGSITQVSRDVVRELKAKHG